MPNDHPFQQLFETFGKLPEAHSESVNRVARETVKAWLDVPIGNAGHCILLKAPRAGHGKTHLLTRLQHELGGGHEFISLHAVGGSRIDAATVLDDTLRRLVRALPAAGGLAALDLVARRLFSTSLQPLVNSGEVPCQDREGALVALRERPIETFDFHHPGAVTAHWAKENFELLGPRLALELSQRNGLPLREVSFWVDALFRFAATPIDNPGRVRALAAQVFDGPSAEATAHDRLVALLGLLTSVLRVVLVADELEGFSLDETAALRFASFIGSLRQSVDRADVILSVNQDIWESAFLPRLSGGLADRLSEVTVEIEPLDRTAMIAVIESRAPGHGEKMVGRLSATYARGIICEAAVAWNRRDEVEPEPTATFEVPTKTFEAPITETPFAAAAPVVPETFFAPAAPVVPETFFAPVAPVVPETPFAPAASVVPETFFAAAAPVVPETFFAPAAPVVPETPFAAAAPVVPETPFAPATMAANVPMTFSPEAAIAAFKAFPEPFDTPVVESPPSPSPFVAENFWPSPDASAPSTYAPTMDFTPSPAPPVSDFQPAPESAETDSPFIIDTAVLAAARPFQESPAPEPIAQPFQAPPAAAVNPVTQAFETAPTPTTESSTDRVDDLLRQFRERYGKS